MKYKVKDIRMAGYGIKQLEWAEQHMPTLMSLKKEAAAKKPLRGARIAALLHVTKETGALARALRTAGAQVMLAASNPLSTQDDIAAALAKEGISVFAWKGEQSSDYYKGIREVLKNRPQIIIDDGADLHAFVHQK